MELVLKRYFTDWQMLKEIIEKYLFVEFTSNGNLKIRHVLFTNYTNPINRLAF
jgi:hypothetical protein